MFGNNNSNKNDAAGRSANAPAAAGHSLNSISQGTVLEGTIRAKNDIRVDGEIKGTLECDAKVIIGPTGKIDGEVTCENAVIEGTLEGTLRVKEMLNVRETAVISGEVSTGKLIVQPGGVFNVRCTTTHGSTAPEATANGQRVKAENRVSKPEKVTA